MVGCSMDMKRRVLEEILADIDDKEGMKLKPKVAEVEIGIEKPEVGEEVMAEGEEEMGDDDLKKLLKEYMG